MSMNTAEQFQIPPEMRALAEKSVEQAKQAVEGFISAAQRTVSALEGQAETARKGAKDVSGKAMGFVEQNVATSFDFAQKADAQMITDEEASSSDAQQNEENVKPSKEEEFVGDNVPSISNAQYVPVAPNATALVPVSIDPTEWKVTPARGLMIVVEDNFSGAQAELIPAR